MSILSSRSDNLALRVRTAIHLGGGCTSRRVVVGSQGCCRQWDDPMRAVVTRSPNRGRGQRYMCNGCASVLRVLSLLDMTAPPGHCGRTGLRSRSYRVVLATLACPRAPYPVPVYRVCFYVMIVSSVESGRTRGGCPNKFGPGFCSSQSGVDEFGPRLSTFGRLMCWHGGKKNPIFRIPSEQFWRGRTFLLVPPFLCLTQNFFLTRPNIPPTLFSGSCWFTTDHDHLATANSKTMPALLSNLTELPIEILAQILLSLPGQDIVEIETVRSISATSI